MCSVGSSRQGRTHKESPSCPPQGALRAPLVEHARDTWSCEGTGLCRTAEGVVVNRLKGLIARGEGELARNDRAARVAHCQAQGGVIHQLDQAHGDLLGDLLALA